MDTKCCHNDMMSRNNAYSKIAIAPYIEDSFGSLGHAFLEYVVSMGLVAKHLKSIKRMLSSDSAGKIGHMAWQQYSSPQLFKQ